MIRDHRPIPGPDYWDFRCIECGANISDHSKLPLVDWIPFVASGGILVLVFILLQITS